MADSRRLLIRIEIILAVLLMIIHRTPASLTAVILFSLTAVLLLIVSEKSVWKKDSAKTAAGICSLLLEGILLIVMLLLYQPVFALLPLAVFLIRINLQLPKLLRILVPLVSAGIILTWTLLQESGLSSLLAYTAAEASALFASAWMKGQAAASEKEIERLNKQVVSKNKLLSTLSHELRTPLTVIKSSTEILLEGRPGSVTPTQKNFLSASLDNTMRLIQFMENILAQIKVEHTWFRMNPISLNLRPLIRKVCKDMQPFLEDQEQSIRYTYPNQLSHAAADRKWIEQVFINLIHNASKHISKGGRILVSVQENEQCIVVSVSDNGSGIRNNEKIKVFSEFYQGKNLDNDTLDGAGIGLAVVKDIIEKHGGKVYLGSVEGLGTTLSFTLPKEE